MTPSADPIVEGVGSVAAPASSANAPAVSLTVPKSSRATTSLDSAVVTFSGCGASRDAGEMSNAVGLVKHCLPVLSGTTNFTSGRKLVTRTSPHC